MYNVTDHICMCRSLYVVFNSYKLKTRNHAVLSYVYFKQRHMTASVLRRVTSVCSTIMLPPVTLHGDILRPTCYTNCILGTMAAFCMSVYSMLYLRVYICWYRCKWQAQSGLGAVTVYYILYKTRPMSTGCQS